MDKILDIRVPVTESTGTCGICIVGGSDTPLRGIFVQHVLPDTVVGKVGLIKSGDRLLFSLLSGYKKFKNHENKWTDNGRTQPL